MVMKVQRWSFRGFELDLSDQTLLFEGRAQSLRPKAWQALVHLVERAGQLVTMAEFLDVLWPRQDVSLKLLTNLIGEVRRALGDDLAQPQFVQTVHRRGYRFVAPVQALPGARPRPADPAPPAGPGNRVGLLGRQLALQALQAQAEQALSRRRALALVTGETGIGKTALVQAFVADAQASRGWLPAHTTCLDHAHEREPFGPMLRLLGDLCAGPQAALSLDVLRRLAPCWLVQMPWLLEPASWQALSQALAGAGVGRMLREGIELFERLAEHRPMLVVVEDLQWADGATLDLLSALAERSRPALLMLVATLDPGALHGQDPQVASQLRRWLSTPLAVHHRLAPLTAPEVAAWIARRFDIPQVDDALAEAAHHLSSGLPAHLAALLDQWEARGAIAPDPSTGAACPDRAALGGPWSDAVQHLVAARLSGLSQASQDLLQVASVLGGGLTAALLAGVLGWPQREVESTCETLVHEHHLLRPLAPVRWADGQQVSAYAFAHELHARVLDDRAARGWRACTLAQAAQVLEQAHAADPDAVTDEVGRLLARAQPDQRDPGPAAG